MIRPAPTRGVWQVARGGALAVCSTGLAVAAHVAGGGGWPDAVLTVLVMVLLAMAGTGLADRRRRLPEILTALAVTQVMWHFALACADAHARPSQAVYWPGWRMVAAHAVAVLVTALVLTKAETAVFAVAAALAHLLPRPLALPTARTETRDDPVISAEPVDHLVHVLFRRVCPRRGPPSLLLLNPTFAL
jgi:hypothetical protein